MPENELFAQPLTPAKLSYAKGVKFDLSGNRLDVCMERAPELTPDQVCGKLTVYYDFIEIDWGHLNFFRYKAYIRTRIQGDRCTEQGIRTVNGHLTGENLNFLKTFEYHAMDFSRDIPVSYVSRFFNECQESVWRILKLNVVGAKMGMNLFGLENIGLNEFSIKRRHHYEAISYDHMEKNGHTQRNRKEEHCFLETEKNLSDFGKVRNLTMDNAKRYILE